MDTIKQFAGTTFSSLKVHNYRLYFIGQSISVCGTWMQTVAQSWLVLQLTGSGTALGVVTALQFLPVLLLGPWGGVIVDRFPNQRILYLTNSIGALLALLLGIVVAAGVVQLWMVYIFALGLGLINIFDNPARQTFALEMVGKEQLTNVVSLNSMIMNGARAVGPAIGGVLIATLGLAWCFVINAFSYTAIIGALYLMRSHELQTVPLVKREKGQLWEGLKYVWHTPVLRNVLIILAFVGTLAYEFIVSLPLLAQFTFHGDAKTYALLMSAFGLGAVIGGLYTARRKIIHASMLVPAGCLFGGAMLLAAIAPTFHLAVAAMLLVGIFSINFNSIGNVTLQLQSAPEMRGRVMALMTVAFLGSTPIGGPIIGWIGEHLGPRWGLAVGGFSAIAAAGFAVLTLSRKEVKIPEIAH